jgi:curved DNA-binding protein CbpA
VSDYYDLLGVDAGADKDTIKAAYREQLEGATQAERAKLNKAWNVLSDPVQRERYDDARSEGWLDDSDGDDATDTTPARRGGGGAGTSPRQRPARPAPEPTVVLPDGMELADARSRGMALLIDFGILFVVYIVALSMVLPALLKDQYPVQTDRIDAINKEIKRLDREKGNADDDAGNKKLSKAQQDAAKKKSTSLQKQINKKNDQITNIAKDFQTFALLMYAVLLAIFLLYAVPSTAITGKTLGMRLRHVRVVRADGSPVTWAGAFGRFVVPFAVALLLPQLGAVIGLGMVLWFLRDKNRQGVHDKIARTLVVAD